MSSPASSSTPSLRSAARIRAAIAALPALLAILLGLLIVGVAGFSPVETIHNAAHDTRHSDAFPCH